MALLVDAHRLHTPEGHVRRHHCSLGDVEVMAASFARHLRAANRSPKTIRTYAEAVDGLGRFLTERGMPRQVSAIRREHVEACIEDIVGGRQRLR
jgi:hypothetical protein